MRLLRLPISVPAPAVLAAALVSGGAPVAAWALPPGRAWSATEVVLTAPYTRFGYPQLRTDAEGLPRLLVLASAPGVQDVADLVWADSAWALTWVIPSAGQPKRLTRLADGRELVPWRGGYPATSRMLAVSQVLDGQILRTDTVGVLSQQYAIEFAFAATPLRRWFVADDDPVLRIYRADSTENWREVATASPGYQGIALTAINDTTALVAWADLWNGLRWGTLRDSVLEVGTGTFDPGLPNRPQFAPREGGGYWLGWASSREHAAYSSYVDGVWSAPESLFAAYDDGAQHFTYSAALDQDGVGFPAMAWDYYTSARGYNSVLVMVPHGDDLPLAEEPPSSRGYWPSITTDRNGDTWVAWYDQNPLPMHSVHTYTAATASTPAVSLSGTDRTLHWTLSELAPETWWAVLAARNGGPYEELARVRAEDALEMSWTDTSPPAAEIRYRIRRECVDTRYQWLSDEVIWDGTTATELALLSADATPERVTLIWQGPGAGALSAQVERRSEDGAWQPVGAAESIGADRLRYEDRAVTPGERYGYRLAWIEDGEAHATAESWIDVPLTPELALEGFTPNPSLREAVVAFTLPSAGRGRLEVMDVAGRRVFRRELGGLGAGRHTLALDASRTLRAGVYLIRLTHGGRVLHARGVVTR
jgi:hypothetical protein